MITLYNKTDKAHTLYAKGKDHFFPATTAGQLGKCEAGAGYVPFLLKTFGDKITDNLNQVPGYAGRSEYSGTDASEVLAKMAIAQLIGVAQYFGECKIELSVLKAQDETTLRRYCLALIRGEKADEILVIKPAATK